MNGNSYSSAAEKASESEALYVEVNEWKHYRKNTASFLVKIAFVVAFALIVLLRFASITEIGHQTNKMRSEYESLEKKNKMLVSELAEYSNVEMLETLAAEKFHMALPKESQKVYIASAEMDHTELYNIELTEEKKETDTKKTFKEIVKRFLGFI